MLDVSKPLWIVPSATLDVTHVQLKLHLSHSLRGWRYSVVLVGSQTDHMVWRWLSSVLYVFMRGELVIQGHN